MKYIENSLEASLPGFTTSGCQHQDVFTVTQAVFAACGRAGQNALTEHSSPHRHYSHDCPALLCEGVSHLQLLPGATVPLRQLASAGI